MSRHAEKDREAGGPGMGRLVTRKRCWLDNDGRITTSRPITRSAAAVRTSIGPQEENILDFSSGEDAACDTGGGGEASSAGPTLPQSCMSYPARGRERSTHNGRPKLGGSGESSQFQRRGDFQEQRGFGDENFQLAPPPLHSQSYEMDTLVPDTAEISLAEYQARCWEPFSADTAASFDMPFPTRNNHSWLFEILPGGFIEGQEQDIVIGTEPAYATDVASNGAPTGKDFLGFGVRGPTAQQRFLHQVLQSLGGALGQNEIFQGEGGRQQPKGYFPPPDVAQPIFFDIPPADSRAGTAARPNYPFPGSPWPPPTPPTRYSTISPTSTLGFTWFDECASTPASPSLPYPTIFAPPLPEIDQATWREVLLFITQVTTNLATGEPGLSWDDPLLTPSALQNYLDLFSWFNFSCPLFHWPSFDPRSVNTLLLVSVLMLGATYGGEEARKMALRVHDGLRGVLVNSVGFFYIL